MYNRDCSSDVDDVEGFAAAATKHLEILKKTNKKQKRQKVVYYRKGKLIRTQNTIDLFYFIYTNSNG